MEKSQERDTVQVSPEILRAFHLMWDMFPSVVLLLRKDRTILDYNQTARDRGIQLGTKCYQLSGDDCIHKECLGNSALEEGAGKRSTGYYARGKRFVDSYWLPIKGEKDLFIHFAIDLTQYANPELFKTV
ncbi:MAG: hypothetical protein L7F78_18570 [Syntrophales bacterium LBB04]|nr:hypothetical protein [Syntrophales bacterium LBB04]